MSRRSTRLSGQDIAPSSPSYSTNSATAGPSSIPARKVSNDEIPYFEEWTTPALQAEVKRYGFKVSRKRDTLIDQLKAVYEALHRSKAAFEPPGTISDPVELMEVAVPVGAERVRKKLILPTSGTMADGRTASKATGKGKGKGRKSDPFVLDVSSDSSLSSSESVILAEAAPLESTTGDLTAQLEREALSETDGELSSDSLASHLPLSSSVSPVKSSRRNRTKSPFSPASSSSEDVPLAAQTSLFAEAGEEEEESPAVDPSPALAETMTAAIRANPAVWSRILRFEPISFDEGVSIATQAGLSMDTGKRKEELRTWLDRQCICFYSTELTGARSRH